MRKEIMLYATTIFSFSSTSSKTSEVSFEIGETRGEFERMWEDNFNLKKEIKKIEEANKPIDNSENE